MKRKIKNESPVAVQLKHFKHQVIKNKKKYNREKQKECKYER